MGNCIGSKNKKPSKEAKEPYVVKSETPKQVPGQVSDNIPPSPQFKLELKQVPQSLTALSMTHLPDEEINAFPHYYQKIQDKLKGQFDIESGQMTTTLQTKLSQIFSISTDLAQMWIMCYIDYMTVLAWHVVHKKQVSFYSPVAIQFVTRVHVLYHDNYQNFCKILLGNNGTIQFAPCKMMVNRDDRLLEHLSNTYMLTRTLMMNLAYNNPDLRKSEKERRAAESIWEPFTITSLKNEFSFTFLNDLHKKKFIHFLFENESKISSQGNSVEELLEVGNAIRTQLALDNLHGNIVVPNIINTFKKQPGGTPLKNACRVDQVVFNQDFLKLLAWEQLINLSEALIWVLEYKKFLFLLLESSHSKARANAKGLLHPSEKIEQVWQLHMQFTEGYSRDIIHNLNITTYPLRDNSIQYQKHYLTLNEAYEFYFGNMNERYWPQSSSFVVGKVGIFHLYIARDLITAEKKRKAIKKFLKYSKRKGKDPLAKLKKDDRTEILESDNVLPLLKADIDFFEIAYEEEYSEDLGNSPDYKNSPARTMKSKQNSTKIESPQPDENLDEIDAETKRVELKDAHVEALRGGAKQSNNNEDDEKLTLDFLQNNNVTDEQ